MKFSYLTTIAAALSSNIASAFDEPAISNIANGTESVPGSRPWLVSIKLPWASDPLPGSGFGKDHPWCGAVLIAPSVVMTAGKFAACRGLLYGEHL
jgi:hypothetical protein